MAILLVMCHHSGFDLPPGGWLGVDIFFVISGYLITRQLLRPGWTFPSFMWRRMARLWPALLVASGAAALLAVAGSQSVLPAIAASTYSYTPVQLTSALSSDDYLGQAWSLAVEMQFYAFWSLFFIAASRWLPRYLLTVCLSVAALVTAGQIALCLAGHENFSYFATPMRVNGLLVGAALAVLPHLPRIHPAAIWTLGGGVVAGVLTAPPQHGLSQPVWGTVAIGWTAAVITFMVAHQDARLTLLMDCRAVRWVGERAYSLYLWHMMVFAVIESHAPSPLDSRISQWAITFTVAALCYRLVERPARTWLTSIPGRRLNSRAAAPNAGIPRQLDVRDTGSTVSLDVGRIDSAHRPR